MITKREKKLMLAASEQIFWEVMQVLEINYPPSINLHTSLEGWLNSPVADNGGTVEQLLCYEIAESERLENFADSEMDDDRINF